VPGAREKNEHLTAAHLLATREVPATRTALDAAVKASQAYALTGSRHRSVQGDRLSHEPDVAGRLARKYENALRAPFLLEGQTRSATK
jgi:hypothetical protein